MAPVVFLRGMLCLPASAPPRALGGTGLLRRARRARAGCPTPPRFDVLAFHPLSVEDPDIPALSALDVSISDIGKVTGLLRRAERLGTVLPLRAKPLWVTELNWQSYPQSSKGVPGRLQAAWVSRGLHRLWVAGVRLVDWQFLIDPYPWLGIGDPTGGMLQLQRPAGLYLAGAVGGRADPALARPKPFLQGFGFPFDPLRVDRRHIRIWGLLARPRQPVLLQRLGRHGRWRTLARLRGDRHGVLNAPVPLVGAARLRLFDGRAGSGAISVGRGRSL